MTGTYFDLNSVLNPTSYPFDYVFDILFCCMFDLWIILCWLSDYVSLVKVYNFYIDIVGLFRDLNIFTYCIL